MQEAYIIAGYRTAVAKSKRGGFRFYRPDDLAITVIKGLLASVPQLDPKQVDDVIVGNAVPEAEQGLQVGRIIAARAVGIGVPGMTVNRYCASGLGNHCYCDCQNPERTGRMYHCRWHGKYDHGSDFGMESCSFFFNCLR